MRKVFGLGEKGDWVPANPEAFGLGRELPEQQLRQKVDEVLSADVSGEDAIRKYRDDRGKDLAMQWLFSASRMELTEEEMDNIAQRLWFQANSSKESSLNYSPAQSEIVGDNSQSSRTDWRLESDAKYDEEWLTAYMVLFGSSGPARDTRGNRVRVKFMGRSFPWSEKDLGRLRTNMHNSLKQHADNGLVVSPTDLATLRLLGGNIDFLTPEQSGLVMNRAKQQMNLAEQRLRSPQPEDLEPFNRGGHYEDPKNGFVANAARVYAKASNVLRVLSAKSLEFTPNGVKIKDPEGMVVRSTT